MLEKSGFGWNDHLKGIIFDSDEKDLDAKLFKNKSFPMYEKLGCIFGKDRANGKAAEALVDVVEELDA
ncbi:hypothetical protein F0562_013701 [Nyssa sinensis]|uniref:Myb/SANT-like domain-containing protein n=1 Tax=Nyssa sinensis TaxID=561372 RepID=A0A5J4ZNL7_9ASTE|nr:hypothetical protein F0562_013701 [Nyssa sinensis]